MRVAPVIVGLLLVAAPARADRVALGLGFGGGHDLGGAIDEHFDY